MCSNRICITFCCALYFNDFTKWGQKKPPKLPQRKIYFWILSNAKSVSKRTDVSVINFANDLKFSCFNVKCKYFRHIMFPIHLLSLVHYTEFYAIFHRQHYNLNALTIRCVLVFGGCFHVWYVSYYRCTKFTTVIF